MEKERHEYLKMKKLDFDRSQELVGKQKKLDVFISNLQEKFDVKITKAGFPFSEIANPTLFRLPSEPKYSKFISNSPEDEIRIISMIKEWFTKQESKTFLIRNNHLIDSDDWLEVDSIGLLEYFNTAIVEFDILHTLIFSPSTNNFITIFEFENEVIWYKGIIIAGKIKYHW
jgi:acyl carrier protein